MHGVPIAKEQHYEISPQRHRQQLDAEQRPVRMLPLDWLFRIVHEHVARKEQTAEKGDHGAAPTAHVGIDNQHCHAHDGKQTRSPGGFPDGLAQKKPGEDSRQKAIQRGIESYAGSSSIFESDGDGEQGAE